MLFEAYRAKQVKWKKPDPGCFVAGTLVHTDKGLVPIEQIKVGDMVLSQPETGGAQAYKPVSKTYVHGEQEVYLLEVNTPAFTEFFGVTPNHPIFNAEAGAWVPAGHLNYGILLRTVDDQVGTAHCCMPMYYSNEAGVGWSPQERGWDGPGTYFDMRCTPPKRVNEDKRYIPPSLDDLGGEGEVDISDHYAVVRRTVYNIEVADFHTYYVGESGVWVMTPHAAKVLFEARELRDKELKSRDGKLASKIEIETELFNLKLVRPLTIVCIVLTLLFMYVATFSQGTPLAILWLLGTIPGLIGVWKLRRVYDVGTTGADMLLTLVPFFNFYPMYNAFVNSGHARRALHERLKEVEDELRAPEQGFGEQWNSEPT